VPAAESNAPLPLESGGHASTDQGGYSQAAAARILIGHANASQLSSRSGALIRAQIAATASSALDSAVSITQ
jgi:hypothetical protein